MLATWPSLKVLETDRGGHATDLALLAIAENATVILVLGGDGTLNEVVNAMGDQCQIPLGVLPCGSGNDTAKSLGIPSETKNLVRHLLNARVKMIDLGLVTSKTHTRYFLNVASCGISAVIAQNVRARESNLSGWAYYFETFKAIFSFKPKQLSVDIDGKNIRHPRCSLLAFANGRYFGGGMQIAPGASLDDGRFDEIAVSNMGLGFFLRHGAKVYRGLHLELPQVYKMRGRVAKVDCISKEPFYIETDGEDAGTLPARFEILPRCLPVLV